MYDQKKSSIRTNRVASVGTVSWEAKADVPWPCMTRTVVVVLYVPNGTGLHYPMAFGCWSGSDFNKNEDCTVV
jgi:hypothetical protein